MSIFPFSSRLRLGCLLVLSGALGTAYAEPAPAGVTPLSNGLLPAGTQISNTAYLDTTDNGNNPSEIASNTVIATVAPVYGTDITPNTDPAQPGQCGQNTITEPGKTGTLTYSLVNTGNIDETYTFGGSNPGDTPPGGSTATPASSFTAYQETNGTDGLQSDDTLITTNGTGQIRVPASSSVKFYLTVPVPANAAAGTLIGIAPYGIPVDDGAAGDNNNIGCLSVASELNLDMTQVPAQSANTPDTKTFSHVVTNTGNAPLSAEQISVDEGGTQYPVSYTASYNGYTSPAQSSLQDALRDVINNSSLAGSYPVGTQITTTEVYTIPAGVANATVNTQSLKPYINTSSTIDTGGNINNNLPQSAETDHPDVLNIVAPGVGTLQKTQNDCGTSSTQGCVTDESIFNSSFTGELSVKSCDVVQYGLSASNTGPGNLFAPVIRDIIPENSTGIYAAPHNGIHTLYRINGGTWAELNNVTAINAASGDSIEFGADVNNDGNVTGDDQIPVNGTFQAQLFTQLAGASCTAPSAPTAN